MSDSPANREGFEQEKQARYERLFDLLADQALFGLEPVEQFELDQLLEEFPEIRADELEATTAAIQAAHLAAEQAQAEADLSELDRLPFHVQAKIAACLEGAPMTDEDAETNLRKSTETSSSLRGASASRDVGSATVSSASSSSEPVTVARPRPKDKMRETFAWLCAAAALVIALLAWLDRGQRDDSGLPAKPLTLAEKRERLIESDATVHQVAWTVNDEQWVAADQSKVSGDIVWSDEEQEGYMTFRGLASSDPSQDCYQLWIFDKTQDEKYPVSGGVFYIDATDEETIVPIDPEITVNQAYLFAITVEKPPGVVVSDRSRLPLIAAVE